MSHTIERINKYNQNGDKLSVLISQLALMGGHVESMFGQTLDALHNRNVIKANLIANQKPELAAMRQTIERDTEYLLTQQDFNAADLRRALCAIKVVADIERIGQLSTNISRRLKAPSSMNALPSITGILRLGKQVQRLLISAMDALAHENSSKAMQVYNSDDDIDRLHATLESEILLLMQDGGLNSPAGVDLMFIVRHFERIADHASNIAKIVYYAQTAQYIDQNIQHANSHG